MNIKVKSCGDCPFRDVYTCLNPKGKYKLTIYNYYLDNTTHPSCPLRTKKITVELDSKSNGTDSDPKSNGPM